MEKIKLYRYTSYFGIDGFDYVEKIQLNEYSVVRETEKGYWIYCLGEKFVLKTEKFSKKRFAYTTKKEALNNFICRKKKQIEITKGQIIRAEQALLLAEKIILND